MVTYLLLLICGAFCVCFLAWLVGLVWLCVFVLLLAWLLGCLVYCCVFVVLAIVHCFLCFGLVFDFWLV